ncbi:MAG: sugar O-acetyltransferase [Bacilli bacterium]
MTEKEKMLAGMLYDGNYDVNLLKEREECKEKCYRYNQLPYKNKKERDELIKELLGSTGENVLIEQPFWCDYGYQISVGENFYMNHGCVILDGGGVVFGDNVFIAPQCGFHTAGHAFNVELRNAGIEYAHPIKVGNNVWIGAGVHVMPGVKIGDNCIIGGGSVVVKDIPAGMVAVGNPCKAIGLVSDREKAQETMR